MITGAQIREARALLGWSRSHLARLAKVQLATVQRAEASAGEAAITLAHQSAIRSLLEEAGVEFTNGDQPGVRLRKQEAR